MSQTAKNRRTSLKQLPNRISITEAAKEVGFSTDKLAQLVKRGMFTQQQDVPGGERFLFRDELTLWINALGTAEERAKEVREFRRSKGRLKAISN